MLDVKTKIIHVTAMKGMPEAEQKHILVWEKI